MNANITGKGLPRDDFSYSLMPPLLCRKPHHHLLYTEGNMNSFHQICQCLSRHPCVTCCNLLTHWVWRTRLHIYGTKTLEQCIYFMLTMPWQKFVTNSTTIFTPKLSIMSALTLDVSFLFSQFKLIQLSKCNSRCFLLHQTNQRGALPCQLSIWLCWLLTACLFVN